MTVLPLLQPQGHTARLQHCRQPLSGWESEQLYVPPYPPRPPPPPSKRSLRGGRAFSTFHPLRPSMAAMASSASRWSWKVMKAKPAHSDQAGGSEEGRTGKDREQGVELASIAQGGARSPAGATHQGGSLLSRRPAGDRKAYLLTLRQVVLSTSVARQRCSKNAQQHHATPPGFLGIATAICSQEVPAGTDDGLTSPQTSPTSACCPSPAVCHIARRRLQGRPPGYFRGCPPRKPAGTSEGFLAMMQV